jgi:hypothetical protein
VHDRIAVMRERRNRRGERTVRVRQQQDTHAGNSISDGRRDRSSRLP